MKITLDQDTLAKAVIDYLRGVGVQSDILEVDFRYTRVPYTVFAQVELAEAQAVKPTRVLKTTPLPDPVPAEPDPEPSLEPLVDPDSLPIEDPSDDEPAPDAPTAPLFGVS